jgi:zinc protease
MKFVNLLLLGALLQGLLAPAYSQTNQAQARQPQTAPAQAGLPAGMERVTAVEGITEYRLNNGLRVLLFPDQSKQTMTVNMTYLVGSRHENYGETGMAHLLEHLLFKGSPKHRDIPKELTEHGARPNGSTWYERTNYFETFAATDENLKWALDLEADRMVNSFVAKKDLDSEMTVVRNEFESGENRPSTVLMQRMMSTAYLWHNYGHSTIGSRADIENVPIERLQAFYKLYYQPDNAALLVAGKFDEAKTLALIKQYFGAIPKPTRKLPVFYTAEPTQDGERQVVLRRSGDVQLVGAMYHVPAGSHPDFAALDILDEVLGNTPSGRLHKALVESGKASGIYSGNYQLREPGVSFFGAEVRQDASLDVARDTLLATVEGLAQSPPTKEEVERARTQLLKQIELNLNSSDRIGLSLSEWLAMGDWRLFFLHRDRIRAVTPEDVQRVALSYFKPSNRTVGVFMPTNDALRAEIPATPDVAAMLKDYKGDAPKSAGEAFDPSPANIEARAQRSTIGNGIKLTLVPKKTRGNTVVATMSLHFGNEQNLMNRRAAADFAGALLMRGTAKHTRQQIQDEMDRLKTRMGVGGGATGANFSIETTRENLGGALALAAEILREPVFSANEFTLLKQERLAGIEQQRKEPNALAAIAFQRYMNPYPKGDVRYVATLDERIEEVNSVKLEDIKKFYSDFYGADHAEFTVVGDFDEAEVKTLANTLFKDWKSPQAYARVPSVYRAVPANDQSLETPDKANAFFMAGVNLEIRDDDPDYPAMVLGNYMTGGGFLSSRLASRIRQKEGLSYGISSQFYASALDRSGAFVASAIYAPENVAKLQVAFKEEVDRVLKDGFTADEIRAAKSGWLQAQQVSRAQDAELARKLTSYSYLDRTLAWDADLEKKVEALTPEQITAALRRHLDPSKISYFKAGDFAKAKGAK